MKGLLLAAGLGSRLRPLTDTLPKPLVPLFDRPCIDRALRWLAANDIREVAINTHWLPDRLHEQLGDGSRWGVHLTWQHEPELLEGVGTVKSFDWFFGDEPVVVVNADVVFDVDLADVLAIHRRVDAVLTLVTVGHLGPLEHPVVWDEAGRLRAIRRTGFEGRRGDQFGIFSGLQVVEPVVWQEVLRPETRWHLAKQLCPDLLSRNLPMACYPLTGVWADIGTRAALDLAHARLLAARSEVYLDHVPEAAPGVFQAPGAKVHGRVVPPVYLGEGAVVEAGAVLGPNSALSQGTRLKSGETLVNGVRLAGE